MELVQADLRTNMILLFDAYVQMKKLFGEKVADKIAHEWLTDTFKGTIVDEGAIDFIVTALSCVSVDSQ